MDELTRKRSRDEEDAAPSAKRASTEVGPPGWKRSFPNDPRPTKAPIFDKEVSSFRSVGTFPSFPPTLAQGAAPVDFGQPMKVGEFSLDGRRRFQNDDSAKRFYALDGQTTRVHFDLRKGYHNFIERDDTEEEYLDFLLRWMVEDRADLGDPDFVCWRGLLKRLLWAPYEKYDGWIIAASKFKGTWFLHQYETEAKRLRDSQLNETAQAARYWGRKFEKYVTSTTAEGKPDLDEVVNSNEGYYQVVKARLNEHSLVFAGEVDCINEKVTPPEYVELKTAKETAHSERQREYFLRFKALKFWAQSFLLGTPTIVCGFRNDEGAVQRLETLKTSQIPHSARQIRGSWDSNVCMRSLATFLSRVKLHATSPDPKDVVLFAFEPKKDIVVWRCPRDSKYVFLPEWFLKGSNRA